MTAITTPKNTPEPIPYSSRLDFTPGGTALVRLLSLKVHAPRVWKYPEQVRRRVQHLARRDLAETTREVLAAVRTTTS